MTLGKHFGQTGRGLAIGAAVLAAVGLTTVPRSAHALSPGAGVGIGLGAFAHVPGSAVRTEPSRAEPAIDGSDVFDGTARETADPTPAFSGGTTPRIASVAGAPISPMPPPAISIWPTISMYDVDADAVLIHHIATPNIVRPVATTALLPTRMASFVPNTAATAIDVATGSNRMPVANGL